MAIMVSLSAEFPLEKPVLRVCPPIVHRWCNEHSEIVNAPGLLNVSLFFIPFYKKHLIHLINFGFFFFSLLYIVILEELYKRLYVNSLGILQNYLMITRRSQIFNI